MSTIIYYHDRCRVDLVSIPARERVSYCDGSPHQDMELRRCSLKEEVGKKQDTVKRRMGMGKNMRYLQIIASRFHSSK